MPDSSMQFFQAIRAGDTKEVHRFLTETPSLITAKTTLFDTPLLVALTCPAPTAMISLLIDSGADVTDSKYFGWNAVMHACVIGVQPEIVDQLLQRWPDEYDWSRKDHHRLSTFSLACRSRKPDLIVFLLARIPKLSQIERDDLWGILSSMAEYKSECVCGFVSRLCETSAAKDLFEYEADSCIKSLIVHADKLGAEKIACFKSTGDFIHVAMIRRLWRSIEAMEAVRPDIVRPLVFVNLSYWMGTIPNAINEMCNQLRRDCLWSQVRDLFLARSQSHTSECDSKILTDLPNVCLRNIVAFYLDKGKTLSELRDIVTQI